MDDDDALPPPIRRSPRAALERQTQLENDEWFEDDDFDEAAPSVPRSRSASIESGASRQDRAPHSNPLASHPISPGKVTNFSRLTNLTNFQPLRQDYQWLGSPQTVDASPPLPSPPPPLPRRSPARLKSFRSNKRLPLHLRPRRVSLETIASVTTTHSIASDEDEEESDPPEASAPSPYFFTLVDERATTPTPSDAYSLESSMRSSSLSSRWSTNRPNTPTASVEDEPHSPKAMFRKMMRKQAGPAAHPNHLVIERTISLDRSSRPSSISGSKSSLPLDRPGESGLFDTERSRSGTSSEWSASSFDATSLTEAELKKCKKKGLNPALFAEMKAARKGKWTSPIAGNTFL
jgi:hypothetical protein